MKHLVNLLNSWAIIVTMTGTWSTAWEPTTWHTAGHTTGHTTHTGHTTITTSSVELHHDGVGNAFKLLLLSLVLFLGGGLVFVEPRDGLVDSGLQLLFISSVKLLV